MQEKCKKEEEEKLQQQKEVHLKEVKELESRIEEQVKLTEAAKDDTERILEMKGTVEEKLRNTLTSFQNFIDTTKGFNKGQSDFMLLDPLKDLLEESWVFNNVMQVFRADSSVALYCVVHTIIYTVLGFCLVYIMCFRNSTDSGGYVT